MITRILAIPQVDKLLDKYFPAFSADVGYLENKVVIPQPESEVNA